jgi:hypothetical protein
MTEPPVSSLLPAHSIPIDTLMRTKFYRPRASSDVIPRGRVEASLLPSRFFRSFLVLSLIKKVFEAFLLLEKEVQHGLEIDLAS